MSLQQIGLMWDESRGWCITNDEMQKNTEGMIKSIKIIIGQQNLEKRKVIEKVPIEDALGSALMKTERSVIYVRSKNIAFLINSDSFIKMFTHNGGRTAKVGDKEFILNECEISMISMVIEEEDFDDMSSISGSSVASSRSVKSSSSKRTARYRPVRQERILNFLAGRSRTW